MIFAAGFLLGSMFGACVGALTIGLLRAAKRDKANSSLKTRYPKGQSKPHSRSPPGPVQSAAERYLIERVKYYAA